MHAYTIRRSGLSAGALLLAALLLALSFGNAHRAAAQASLENGCDPSEAVACITPPVQEGAGPAPTIGAPLPPAPGACTPVSVQAASPSVAIGTPISPGCPVQEIVATMNRANVLWARALRTTDTSELSQVWGGQALAAIEGYVATLRNAGQYATPQLQSIILTGIQTNGQYATLTTTERWLMQLRLRFSGQIVEQQLQHVQNRYGLERTANGWRVVQNEVWPVTNPVPPLPVPPAPPVPLPPNQPSPPCILIYPPPPGCSVSEPQLTVTTDRAEYQRGETVIVTITNTGDTTLAGGGGYRCGFVEVAVARGGDVFVPAPGGADACPEIALLLQPGESRTEAITLTEPGVYRMIARATAQDSTGKQVIASAPLITVH